MAYIRRLHQLELITERQYRSLVIDARAAGYRTAEGHIPRETSQLIPKALGLLEPEGVTMATIADELQLPIEDLRGLAFERLQRVDGNGETSSRRAHLRIVR